MAVHASRVHSESGNRYDRSGSTDSMKFGSPSCGTLRPFPSNRTNSSPYREPTSFTGRDRYPMHEASSRVDYNDEQSRQYPPPHQRRPAIYDSFMEASSVMPPGDCNGGYSQNGNDQGCRRAASFLHEMWIEQKMCDVVIRCSGTCCGTDRNEEQSILAHKIALAAYSEYLVGQFIVYPPNEIVSIDLTRFPYDDVGTVVKFVYTGELKLTRDSVGPIWQVADGLGIVQIVRMCEDFLGQTTPENAIYHYAVAEQYNLKELSKKIFAFIQDRFIDVCNSVDFQFLPFERLVHLLKDDRLNINNELDVYEACVRWIDSDRQKRLGYAPRLLRETIRLHHISPECLITHIESVSWIFDAQPECQLLVNDAIRFHALSLTASSLADQFPLQAARGSVQHR